MYSILIVDDERMIRNGLRDVIPWGDLDVTQVYTAASAKEALGVMEQNHVDILLTDICMPETTGIELVSQLGRTNPPLRTVVLTGYNDFEYAQQCCKIEVHDFLLKPINEKELVESIRTQIGELEKFRQNSQISKIQSRAQEMNDALWLERALRGLARGDQPLDEAADILERYGYDITRPVQVALVIPHLVQGEDWLEENELRVLRVKNVCLEMIDAQHMGITFEDLDGKLGVVLFESHDINDAYSYLEALANRVQDETGAAPKMILGSRVEGLGDLHISYNDALHLLKETSGHWSGKIYQTQRVEKRMRDYFAAFGNCKLYLCANITSEENLLKGMEMLRELFEEYNLSLPFLRRCCFEVVSSAYYTYMQESGQDPDDRLGKIMGLLQTADRDTVLMLTRDFMLKLFPSDEPETNQIIQAAKQYINEHLADELSVSSVAAHLFINSNYFSRLFKQAAGEGCNEYITRKRMEKAKTLLESSSMKAGKVAEEVGYRDKNYFSLSFKKYTGLSPTAYRASVRQN